MTELTEISELEVKRKDFFNFSSIQMLRAIAAIAVGIAHLHTIESKLGGKIIFGDWALNGFFGVDLFFAISGFVMVYITQNFNKPKPNIIQFWGLRLFRIYPLWWLICGLVYIVYIYRPDLVFANTINNPNIIKSFLLIPQASLPLHAVGWTLIHELYFYIVFGIFLLFPRKYLPILLSIWGLVTIGIAISFYGQINNPFLLIILSPLNIEFISGAFAGLLFFQKIKINARFLIITAIIWLVINTFLNMPNPNEAFSNYIIRSFSYSIPCAALILGMVMAEKNYYNAPIPMVSLGNWSFSFYLLHVLVFSAIGKIGARFANDGIFDNIILSLLAMAVTAFSSFITYKFFEKPIINFSHKLFGRA